MEVLSDFVFRESFVLSIGLLGIAVVSVVFAQWYLRRAARAPFGDFVLDALPEFPLPTLLLHVLVWGSIGFTVSAAVIVFIVEPVRFPAAVSTVALMYIVRSAFLCTTRFNVHPGKIPVPDNRWWSWVARFVYGGNDLFFSGHVALPATLSFLFWDLLWLRAYFIGAAVFFGIAALLAKSHYTIDVVAAPFAAYGIYAFAKNVCFTQAFAFIGMQ